MTLSNLPRVQNNVLADDLALVDGIEQALTAAGRLLLERLPDSGSFANHGDVVEAILANDSAALASFRPALTALRPGARWVDDELASGLLPEGEWWVTDPVEGNINHVHGMTDWGVTATLIRDNVPVVTVVHLPVSAATYTAVLGGGAFLNGTRIRPSLKRELDAALAGTGQASPREDIETFTVMGRSITAMLAEALVLRVSVPATLQLLQVAAGRMDVFWQHSAVRSGLVAGALLVSEAGGIVSDLRGAEWTLGSEDFLATAPNLHAEAVRVLAPLS